MLVPLHSRAARRKRVVKLANRDKVDAANADLAESSSKSHFADVETNDVDSVWRILNRRFAMKMHATTIAKKLKYCELL